MDSATIMHAAVSLNNQGVRLLFEGNVKESLVSFRQAISSSRAEVELEMESTDCALGPDESTISAIFQVQAKTVSGLQNGYYFVYDRPFLLPVSGRGDSGTDSSSPRTPECEPAVHPYLLFNLALASHCAGKKTGSHIFMARAGLIYDLLIRILRTSTWRADPTLNVLAILAVNNAATLHYELGSHDECKARFLEMEHQLCGSDVHLNTFLVVAEADALRLNVQQARPPSPLAPAA